MAIAECVVLNMLFVNVNEIGKQTVFVTCVWTLVWKYEGFIDEKLENLTLMVWLD